MISRSRRTRSQVWDCSHEPVVQPIAPTVSAAPASTSAIPRSSTSISGTKVSPPKNAPGQQATDQDHRRQPAAEPQEAGRHQPGSPNEQGRDTYRDRPMAYQVQPLTGGLERGGTEREQAGRPIDCGFTVRRGGGPRLRISWISDGASIAPPTATSGSTAKNTQCQLRLWVSQAEIGGPTNDGTTHAVEMYVNTRGRCPAAKSARRRRRSRC